MTDQRTPAARTCADTLAWMASGTDVFLTAVGRASDERLGEPTALPGWTGRHLVAHVAANADALRNLVHWARTGEPTPMYRSADQRVTDIDAGARRDAPALRTWARSSAASLAEDLDGLTAQQWAAQVSTAQGRTVPASEVPWMRAREVWVHTVDLGPVSFSDLPRDFLTALVTEVADKRGSGPGPALTVVPTDSDHRWHAAGEGAVEVSATLADLAAYLTGRPGGPVTTTGGKPAPGLGPWL